MPSKACANIQEPGCVAPAMKLVRINSPTSGKREGSKWTTADPGQLGFWLKHLEGLPKGEKGRGKERIISGGKGGCACPFRYLYNPLKESERVISRIIINESKLLMSRNCSTYYIRQDPSADSPSGLGI